MNLLVYGRDRSTMSGLILSTTKGIHDHINNNNSNKITRLCLRSSDVSHPTDVTSIIPYLKTLYTLKLFLPLKGSNDVLNELPVTEITDLQITQWSSTILDFNLFQPHVFQKIINLSISCASLINLRWELNNLITLDLSVVIIPVEKHPYIKETISHVKNLSINITWRNNENNSQLNDTDQALLNMHVVPKGIKSLTITRLIHYSMLDVLLKFNELKKFDCYGWDDATIPFCVCYDVVLSLLAKGIHVKSGGGIKLHKLIKKKAFYLSRLLRGALPETGIRIKILQFIGID